MNRHLLLFLTLSVFAWQELEAATPTPTPSRRRSPASAQATPSPVKPSPLPQRTAAPRAVVSPSNPPVKPSIAPQRTAIPKPSAAQLSSPPVGPRKTPTGPDLSTRVPGPSSNDNRLVKGNEKHKNFNAGTAPRTLAKAVVPENEKLTEIKPSGPPIALQNFELLDPETGKTTRANGQPFTADSMITLPNGKTMTAGEYYKKINEVEADLAKKGRSLRQLKAVPPDELTKLLPYQRARKTMTAFADPVVNESLRVKQASQVKSIHRALNPARLITPLDSVLAEKPTTISSAPLPSTNQSLSAPEGLTARILTATTEAEMKKAVQDSAQVRRANLETSFKKTTQVVRQRLLERKSGNEPKAYLSLGKLLVFTNASGSNLATANTNTGGDITPYLKPAATVANAQFALRWELSSPAAVATDGILKVKDASTGAQVGSVSVTIAAKQSHQNIYFQFPAGINPGAYVAAVYVDKTTSSKVSLNFTDPRQ
jgi:hypothetical protein